MPTLRLLAALLLVTGLVACDSADAIDPPTARAEARYTVTLDATWSAETHPDAFPPNPHFSRLTGAAHAPDLHVWRMGEPASDGVKGMAETGSTIAFRAEIEALGDRTEYVEGGPIRTSPGTASAAVTVTEAHPLATVVSMIAPSPDWFVGVDGLDLRDGDGWADRVTVDLRVYDSGTDSGTSYTAGNAPSAPRAAIAQTGYAPLAGSVVGTLTFERVE